MSNFAQMPNSPIMVNYTSVLTSASNEIYISKTESPESLASLMKNTITIEFSLSPIEEKEVKKGEGHSATAL